MPPVIENLVKKMTVDERISLVDEISENLVGDDLPLTPAQKEELDRRLDAMDRGEMELREWDTVEAELLGSIESRRAA